MRRARAAALAAPAVLLIVAAVRAQVQQEPFLETTEGTGINITCTHSKKLSGDYIHFYRQLPGKSPEFLALTARGSKPLSDTAGSLSMSEDGSSSWLWLAEPRRGDAAVYYCTLGATGRGAGAAAGHEPPRAGPEPNTGTGTGTGTDTGNGYRYRSPNGTGTDTTIDTGTVIDPSGASRGNLSNIQKNKCQDLAALQALQGDNA
ncbi:probable non-functional immunoglobulinn kappa variable 1-37 [Ammospiza nelsoni]|uniref:probable non-functional immunoglobulinn kappa variable 1-37 n=1 Tax=Ammospiza nelsoni TaxID=2857394 RepID=UPI00286B0714|nr:probable non-functional immunoglobulinn kappa variable 1-37 [Ammospiza nelsoni]